LLVRNCACRQLRWAMAVGPVLLRLGSEPLGWLQSGLAVGQKLAKMRRLQTTVFNLISMSHCPCVSHTSYTKIFSMFINLASLRVLSG
jgi:hypothetical protein